MRFDPNFALAWALLSFVDSVGYIGITLQATESLREEARQAAERALTLQPNLGEGLVAKGYYDYAYLKDYPSAVRYFEQARPLLPNSSRIPELLAFVARREGRWEQSESFFNQAEQVDPRNVSLLSQHALSYILLRRFPEALRKLDQVLNITPDDVDTLALKASIAQAEGDLPRASAILGPLHPVADNTAALETQVYQAILERRTDQIISRLNEILARPDPAMGYFNGELRFWLGWAQQVGGDHAAAQESWRHAQSDLKGFLQEQPENYNLMHDLALVEMGLGNKAAALAMAERAIATNPIEKDVVDGPASIEILARVAAQAGEPDRAVAALQKLLSIPYEGALPVGNAPLTAALLRFDPMFDPLRNDPRFQKLCEDKLDKRIAVLPFENLSDPHDEYFSDGLSEELISALAQISELKVIGRSSSFRFKDRKEEPKTIGEKLGVSTLLEGTVRKQGNRVRIVAALTNAADGIELWTRTFDRELKDIFAVQEEIAKAVAESLKVRLLGSDDRSTQRTAPNSVEAHNAYLQGHFYFQRRNLEDYRKAVSYFDEAIRLDPNYALAYAERSEAWTFIGDLSPEQKEAWAAARKDAEKAVAVGPNLAEAHAALGWVRFFIDWKFADGLSELKRAKELSPANPTANDLLARVIFYLGRLDEAEQQARHAVELDPLSVMAQGNLARALFYAGKLDEADAVARKAAELQPAAASNHRWQVLVAVTAR